MMAAKRRSFADMADSMLDAAAATSAPSSPATASPPPVRQRAAAASSAGTDDDDGPRLRASGAAARLAGGDIVRRTVYVGADDWRAVLRLAMRRGVTASDVLRQALRDYLERGDGST